MEATADLHGVLARYELVMLLRSLRAERFTGRLELSCAEERVALFAHRGELLYARSYALRHSFPAWLVRQRVLPRETVKAVFRDASTARRTFDEVVVEQGHLTPISLVATRQSLARYVLTFAFSLDPASWAGWRTACPPDELLRVDLDPERAFFRFVAQRDSVDAQVAALKDRFEEPIQPTDLLPDREAAFRAVFGAQDPIYDAIAAGSTSIAALLAAGTDAFQIVPRVFALHRSGLVRFSSREDPDSEHQWADAIADLSTASQIAARHGRRGTVVPGEGEELPTGACPLPSAPLDTPTPGGDASGDTEDPSSDEASLPVADPGQAALSWLSEAETASHYELLRVSRDASDDEVCRAAALVRGRLEQLRSALGQQDDPNAASALRAIAVRVDQAERTLTDARRRKLYNSSRGLS